MAINIPIITSLEDKGIQAAKTAFGNFKTAVGDAEGGLNKFKAGSKVAFDTVQANAAVFAVAAGAAIGKFALKAIGDFQDLALSAGKFSDATGLAVEDASRYIEAAGDIGIPIEAVETAIGKLNKTIGADPDKVRDLGVDLVYLKDGSLDVNATFLETIERIKGIKDPAEKAKVASELLGKGWKNMAELIEMGSDSFKASLASVSDQKIIDEDEVQRARDFRDSMDQLKGKFEDVALAVGEKLLPVVQNLLDKAVALSEVELPGWMSSLATAAELSAKTMLMGPVDAIRSVNGQVDELIQKDSAFTVMLGNTKRQFDDLASAAEDAAEEFQETNDAWLELKNSLALDSQMISAREGLDKLKETALEAFLGSKDALAEYEQGLINAQLMVLKLAENVNLTNAQQNQIRVLVETGDLEYAYSLMDAIRTNGHVDLVKAAAAKALAAGRGLGIPGGMQGGSVFSPANPIIDIPGRASGGPVMGGSSYLVGERGPELFTPSSSGNITPNGAMGGNTITVNVNGGDPNAVVAALQRWVRDNGAIPMTTTTAIRR